MYINIRMYTHFSTCSGNSCELKHSWILWSNFLLRVGFIVVTFMMDMNLAEEKNLHS